MQLYGYTLLAEPTDRNEWTIWGFTCKHAHIDCTSIAPLACACVVSSSPLPCALRNTLKWSCLPSTATASSSYDWPSSLRIPRCLTTTVDCPLFTYPVGELPLRHTNIYTYTWVPIYPLLYTFLHVNISYKDKTTVIFPLSTWKSTSKNGYYQLISNTNLKHLNHVHIWILSVH